MPKKTHSQHLGEAGSAAIMALLVRSGWSVDFVRSDYGEDLVAQTFLNGEADPFRIILQVKTSTRLRSVKFPRDHLIKWISSLDLFVVAFWDEKCGVAYYHVPADIWELSDV